MRKQHVRVTLSIGLWLDAGITSDDITTFVRSQLPDAFGETLTTLENPVDLLAIEGANLDQIA